MPEEATIEEPQIQTQTEEIKPEPPIIEVKTPPSPLSDTTPAKDTTDSFPVPGENGKPITTYDVDSQTPLNDRIKATQQTPSTPTTPVEEADIKASQTPEEVGDKIRNIVSEQSKTGLTGAMQERQLSDEEINKQATETYSELIKAIGTPSEKEVADKYAAILKKKFRDEDMQKIYAQVNDAIAKEKTKRSEATLINAAGTASQQEAVQKHVENLTSQGVSPDQAYNQALSTSVNTPINEDIQRIQQGKDPINYGMDGKPNPEVSEQNQVDTQIKEPQKNKGLFSKIFGIFSKSKTPQTPT